MQQYTGNTTVITNIGTNPSERGLTTDQFKAKFDQTVKDYVTWFNTEVSKDKFLNARGVNR